MRAITILATVGSALASMHLAQPRTASAQTGVVEAGGMRCITYTPVRQVVGVYDSSYVQYTNRCGEAVGFFWCQASVFQPSNPPSCNASTGVFNMTTAGIGWTQRMSHSSRGQLVVSIRECPAGLRPYLKTNGRFYCRS